MYYDDSNTPMDSSDDKVKVCMGSSTWTGGGWQALGHWEYISGTTDIKSSNSGNVGIGTNNPGYKLDVQGGQVNAYGGLCINNDCKTSWSSVSGGMSSSQINTSAVNINAVKGYSKITVDGVNYALPYYTYGNFLVNSKHNIVDCTLAGGIVMNDDANSFCKFSSNAVPVGWSQYLNWSSTKASTAKLSNGNGGQNCASCSHYTPNPGTHSWANIAQECGFFKSYVCGYNSSSGCEWELSSSDTQICSTIYEIGGY